jgi:L-threonate 2-dehydrogenase
MAGRTIAVLSPGEMGAQVGRLLHEAGNIVVTCTAERSERSRARAEQAGLTAMPDLDAVARSAELIICVVPSLSAEPLAAAVTEAVQRVGSRPIYVDANSIGPETARRIAQAVEAAGARFVDGSIIGSANVLARRGTMYLSGPAAADVAELIDPPLHPETLGPEPGQASAFKVLYAGLTKGLSALGVELLAGAERLGLREPLLAKYAQSYPDIRAFFDSTLPGLPERSRRRAEEMVELSETLEGIDLTANMAHAAQTTLEQLATQFQDRGAPEREDLDALVRWLVAGRNP